MLYNIDTFRQIIQQSAPLSHKTPVLYIVKVAFGQLQLINSTENKTIVLCVEKLKEKLRIVNSVNQEMENITI